MTAMPSSTNPAYCIQIGPQRGDQNFDQLPRRVRVTRRAAAILLLCPPQRRPACRLSHLPFTVPCPAMTRPRAFRRWCRSSRLWPHRSAPRALSAPLMWRSSQPPRAPPRAARRRRGTRQVHPPEGAPATHPAGFPPAPPRSIEHARKPFYPFKIQPPLNERGVREKDHGNEGLPLQYYTLHMAVISLRDHLVRVPTSDTRTSITSDRRRSPCRQKSYPQLH